MKLLIKLFNMGTHKYKNKVCNIYKYGELEFFFIDDEEKKFWALLNEYKNTESIPDTEFLKGIFFQKGTRNTDNFENGHIAANQISK